VALAFDLQILSDVPFRPERNVPVHYIVNEKKLLFADKIICGCDLCSRFDLNPFAMSWQDSPHLGCENLPNKYFYRCQPPVPAKDLLAEFWKPEKEAEMMLKMLAQ